MSGACGGNGKLRIALVDSGKAVAEGFLSARALALAEEALTGMLLAKGSWLSWCWRFAWSHRFFGHFAVEERMRPVPSVNKWSPQKTALPFATPAEKLFGDLIRGKHGGDGVSAEGLSGP
jgi:hypothetical protein